VSRFLTEHQQSVHLGYTVPFMLVHAGKYMTEDKLKIQYLQIYNTDNTETKHKAEKANNAKYNITKLAWFSCLLRHSARK